MGHGVLSQSDGLAPFIVATYDAIAGSVNYSIDRGRTHSYGKKNVSGPSKDTRCILGAISQTG